MSCNSFLTPIDEILTDDLLAEILKRLPVKLLLRCKAVSKPWLSIISSPNFVKSHIRHAITRPRADENLIVYTKPRPRPRPRAGNSLTLLNLHSHQIGPLLSLPCSGGEYSITKLVGSYDGIVCVFNSDNIYIWNPATRQSKLVPRHNIQNKAMWVALGFGFDPVGNDFKVVRVVTSFNKSFSAEVYSTIRNAWEMVERNPDDVPYYDQFDICVDGLLCSTGLDGLMMAFDLSNEVFKSGINLPVECCADSDYKACFTVVNDSIAVSCFSKNTGNNMRRLNGKMKLWTLDDHACLRDSEVETSWTPMLSIDVDVPMFIRAHFNSGDLLLVYDCTSIWLSYNHERRELVPNEIDIREVIKYNESLVSIGGSKQVKWNDNEDDN